MSDSDACRGTIHASGMLQQICRHEHSEGFAFGYLPKADSSRAEALSEEITRGRLATLSSA